MIPGGGGLSVQSSSSAESAARAGNVGVEFGDNVVGGLKFNPLVIGIIALGIIGAIWAWKR